MRRSNSVDNNDRTGVSEWDNRVMFSKTFFISKARYTTTMYAHVWAYLPSVLPTTISCKVQFYEFGWFTRPVNNFVSMVGGIIFGFFRQEFSADTI